VVEVMAGEAAWRCIIPPPRGVAVYVEEAE
jgi:hypothetical protein